MSPTDQTDPPEPRDEIRLAPSALFVTAGAPIPPGIRRRDLESLAAGLVEEHSPLPMEQTAWGYAADSRRKAGGAILCFAAIRDHLFGKESPTSGDLDGPAVVPGFVSLRGLRFRRSTWVFLLEDECVSAARFDPGDPVPREIVSRFRAEGSDDPFALRQRLADDRVDPGTDDEVEGLLRSAGTKGKRKGTSFLLERLSAPDSEWSPWRETEPVPTEALLAADVRDREKLASRQREESSARRMKRTVAAIGIAVALLGIWEILEFNRGRTAAELARRAELQRPEVDRLREIESMTTSLAGVIERDFEPFRWLMVLNESRPPEISFGSFALAAGGNLRVNGEGPGIQALNDYVDALDGDPRIAEARSAEVRTDSDGVSFAITAKTGDLSARPVDAPARGTGETTTASEGGGQG